MSELHVAVRLATGAGPFCAKTEPTGAEADRRGTPRCVSSDFAHMPGLAVSLAGRGVEEFSSNLSVVVVANFARDDRAQHSKDKRSNGESAPARGVVDPRKQLGGRNKEKHPRRDRNRVGNKPWPVGADDAARGIGGSNHQQGKPQNGAGNDAPRHTRGEKEPREHKLGWHLMKQNADHHRNCKRRRLARDTQRRAVGNGVDAESNHRERTNVVGMAGRRVFVPVGRLVVLKNAVDQVKDHESAKDPIPNVGPKRPGRLRNEKDQRTAKERSRGEPMNCRPRFARARVHDGNQTAGSAAGAVHQEEEIKRRQ